MKYYAYIDESGNCDLNSGQKGGSPYYVVACVLVKEENVTCVSDGMKNIVLKYCGNGELKSSSIGNKHQRRIDVLSETKSLDYTILSLVVDKRQITSPGLKFKKTFVKFINGLLFERLFKTFSGVQVVMDESGSPEFKKELRQYLLGKKRESILFDYSDIRTVDSRTDKIVQLADLICGTIAKIQSRTIPDSLSIDVHSIIKDKFIYLEYWPPLRKSIVGQSASVTTTDKGYVLDRIVRSYCVDIALDYLANNPDFGDKDIICRHSALKYLLMQIDTGGKNRFVYSNEIIKHVEFDTGQKLNLHALSSKVISKLRESDVIISSGDKGYKIPCSVSDITQYITSTDLKVVPMIRRIAKASRLLRMASNGTLDLIQTSASEKLQEIILKSFSDGNAI